jgi:hypothetical protein
MQYVEAIRMSEVGASASTQVATESPQTLPGQAPDGDSCSICPPSEVLCRAKMSPPSEFRIALPEQRARESVEQRPGGSFSQSLHPHL